MERELCMNSKAEAFKNYLDGNDLGAFEIEEVAGDEQGTVIFRSNVSTEGQQLPTIVLVDDSVFTMIRIQVSPGARTKENELQVLRLINDQNLTYKPFKLYFDNEGSLILDTCILVPGEDFSQLGEEIYGMFDILIDFLNKNYRALMKKIWGEEPAPSAEESTEAASEDK